MILCARRFRAILIACIAVSLAGCYTLLKHPSTDDGFERNDFTRCYECHEDFHNFSPYQSYHTDPWWDYYALPWWYDEIIVISGDEEIPLQRAIHEHKTIHRDEPAGTGSVGVKRTVPGSGVREKKEGDRSSEGEGKDSRIKIRKKEATKSKRTGTRERGGGRRGEKEKSDTDGTRRDGKGGGGKEKHREREGNK